MTNAEKMIELLEKTFDIKFTSVEFLQNDCSFIECPDKVACLNCPYKNFWKEEYKPIDKS